MALDGKNVLITGSARRIGRSLAQAVAGAGGNVIIHHGHSPAEAEETKKEIERTGQQAYVIQADLENPEQAADLVIRALEFGPLFGLVNNAAVFEPLNWENTTIPGWQRHLSINLTAPFLTSQAFARSLPAGEQGRIINILDWRAMRPGPDHLPYTISKAALAALTQSLAQAFAPEISVNGVALGAVLPPSDVGNDPEYNRRVIAQVPAGRWAELEEVNQALMFFLAGPDYITGEILHVDGGRHLV